MLPRLMILASMALSVLAYDTPESRKSKFQEAIKLDKGYLKEKCDYRFGHFRTTEVVTTTAHPRRTKTSTVLATSTKRRTKTSFATVRPMTTLRPSTTRIVTQTSTTSTTTTTHLARRAEPTEARSLNPILHHNPERSLQHRSYSRREQVKEIFWTLDQKDRDQLRKLCRALTKKVVTRTSTVVKPTTRKVLTTSTKTKTKTRTVERTTTAPLSTKTLRTKTVDSTTRTTTTVIATVTSDVGPQLRTGRIVVKTDAGTTLGFLSLQMNDYGEYHSFVSNPDDAIVVSFRAATSGVTSQLELAPQNSGRSYPAIGGIRGYANSEDQPDDIGSGNYNYQYIGDSRSSTAGEPSESKDNTFTDATQVPSNVQTHIFNFDPVTKSLTVTWVNGDKSKKPGFFVISQDALIIVGDVAANAAIFGVGTSVTLHFLDS